MATVPAPPTYESTIGDMHRRIGEIRQNVAETRAAAAVGNGWQMLSYWSGIYGSIRFFCLDVIWLYEHNFLRTDLFELWYSELIKRW